MPDLVTLALLKRLQDKAEEAKEFKAVPGPQGERGPKGEKGDPGIDGAPGTDGRDGKDGKDGKDGEEGVGVASVSETADGDLLFTLTNGDEYAVELNILNQNKEGDTYVSISKPGGSSGDLERIFTAGEPLLPGEVAFYGPDGKMYKTNAGTESAISPLIGVSLSTLAANEPGKFLLMGFMELSGFNTSDKLYVAPANGVITNERPSGGGQFVRVVGYAISNEEIYFNPDATWIGLEAN